MKDLIEYYENRKKHIELSFEFNFISEQDKNSHIHELNCFMSVALGCKVAEIEENLTLIKSTFK